MLLSSAGLVRLLVPPAVVAATVPWLARPTVARTARVLRRMVAPGGRVPDEQGRTDVVGQAHGDQACLKRRRSGPGLRPETDF
ncbi:hypothetical protein [Streptomyces soliscabiei]|uniref:hypothetical protein n=1 Tax=Streptomyces soliscabiei TaxID=588897 RepID=UPI0029A1580D|nr:hypothetical protein [Streptomyces sp. NY05-11A]MDX2681692.1 hypothetical protein [Streptomyces sp. NY05-11A]